MNWKSPLPLPNQANISLNDRLSDLLIETWSTNVSYQHYFGECAPQSCTYIDTSYISLSYTATLLISLYGGIIIILRLVVVSLVNLFFIFKRRPGNMTNTANHRMTCIQRLGRWINRLNLFKSVRKQSATDIKQQRITTRAYLIVLASMTFHCLKHSRVRRDC